MYIVEYKVRVISPCNSTHIFLTTCWSLLLIFFTPFILFSNFFFLFWSKVIRYVKGFSYFFYSFSPNHVCDSFTTKIKQWFNIQIVGSKNNFKQNVLFDINKFLVPFKYIVTIFRRIFVIVPCVWWVFLVIFSIFNYFFKNFWRNIFKRNRRIFISITNVFYLELLIKIKQTIFFNRVDWFATFLLVLNSRESFDTSFTILKLMLMLMWIFFIKQSNSFYIKIRNKLLFRTWNWTQRLNKINII